MRKDENFSNRRKYSEQDVENNRQAQAEMDGIYNEMQDELDKRERLIVAGLMQKYSFSENGAKETMRLIKKSVNMMGESFVSFAKFWTQAQYDAAQRAYDFYWK